MKHNFTYLIFSAFALFLLASCATQYHVEGSTDRTLLEGKVLYLKVYDGDSMRTIDSCLVRHGQLNFSGVLDSTQMVNLFVGDESMGPIVLEEGVVNISLNELKSEVTGTPLNDTLNVFLGSFQQIINARQQLNEEYQKCQKREAQMIMDGKSEEEINAILSGELQHLMLSMSELDARQDALETSFIVSNSNNILGPGIFMIMTCQYPYPYLTPQIEEILFRASPYLKNHPYVKKFIEAAKANMDSMHK